MGRPTWLAPLDDEAVLSAVDSAARACMTEADECDPDRCQHAANRLTPLEFAAWLRHTIATARRGRRADHRENHRAGQRARRHLEIVHPG